MLPNPLDSGPPFPNSSPSPPGQLGSFSLAAHQSYLGALETLSAWATAPIHHITSQARAVGSRLQASRFRFIALSGHQVNSWWGKDGANGHSHLKQILLQIRTPRGKNKSVLIGLMNLYFSLSIF